MRVNSPSTFTLSSSRNEQTLYVVLEDAAEPGFWFWIWHLFELVIFAGIMAVVSCVIGIWLVRNYRFQSRRLVATLASVPIPAIWFAYLWRPFTFSDIQSRWAAFLETIQDGLGTGLILSILFGWLGVWMMLRRVDPDVDARTFH